MSIYPQLPVPLVTLVKTEPVTVIKNEPPEEALKEEISTDVKEDIDIVYHPLSEDLIKSETALEDILENKHLESVQTQAIVKAENTPFIKTENTTQRNKTEDTSDENAAKGIGEGVVEIQGSNEYSNVLSNLETDTQLALNFSKDLNDIHTRTRKAKQPEKTNFVKCYKTADTTSWKKDKEKIKVIKAPMIPVEAYEYTSLAKDKHVCNHCQHAYNKLSSLKRHIEKIHRELTTMYHCPYCTYKSKWSVRNHMQKHKDTKDIQWFQCNLCEMKFKLKHHLTQHMKVHLKHKQMKDGLDLSEKRHHCDKCYYKTYASTALKRHELTHLKPEEIQYFYCYHCSYKSKEKGYLKHHIFRQHFKNDKQVKRYHCDKCDYKAHTSANLKNHTLTHLNPEEIQYFYCYHCSYKAKRKMDLKKHIFTHFKNDKQEKRYHCDKCDYKAHTSANLKNHTLTHLNPEEVQYFYCYHCSHKSKRKMDLKKHIFRHFKNGQVRFDCYICNFMTSKRESIIKHIKKHSKVRNNSEINEGS